jgi:hypothetical protein
VRDAAHHARRVLSATSQAAGRSAYLPICKIPAWLSSLYPNSPRPLHFNSCALAAHDAESTLNAIVDPIAMAGRMGAGSMASCETLRHLYLRLGATEDEVLTHEQGQAGCRTGVAQWPRKQRGEKPPIRR